MDKRKRGKHRAHKRALVVCAAHRPFFDTTPGGATTFVAFDKAVGVESASFTDQEDCRSRHQAASERCETARRTVSDGSRHVATVSTLIGIDGATFSPSRPANDEELMGWTESVLAGASAHAERFVNAGVQPSLLDLLARELAAFRESKNAMTLAGRQFTQAGDRLNHALDQGDAALLVLEGILATSPDAPVGALRALQQAKMIGPRAIDEDEPPASDPAPVPALAVPADPDKAA